MKFFSLNKSELAANILAGVNANNEDSLLQIDVFKDGEILPIFKESIRDHHLFIIADGHNSENIVKLLLTIDAAKRSGAKKITVVYPYAPYSRQDKNDHVRSSIGAKMLANVLEKVGVTRLITIEMHSPSIQGFYDIPVIHLSGNKIFIEYAKSLNLIDVTVLAPDHGALKRNTDFGKRAFPDSPMAIIDKKRVKPNEIASMQINGAEFIKGRNIVCVDDMADTIGTLDKASKLAFENGALTFRAFLTHPVLSGDALKTLFNSQITELVVSDTIASVYEKKKRYEEMLEDEAKQITNVEFELQDGDITLSLRYKERFAEILEEVINRRPKFTIVSCADLLAHTIKRAINKQSINDLNIA